MPALITPVATAGPEELADYIELSAFGAADRNSSLQDLIQGLRRTGTSEEFDSSANDEDDSTDRGGEKSEASALDAFAELEDRRLACGGQGPYPFEILDRSISLLPESEKAVYTFLLLLSRYGLTAGPRRSHPERLFEEVALAAAQNYFGGRASGARALHFGFPRRMLPSAFPAALRTLLSHINDGISNEDAPANKHQKDGKLDLVAWREFPDRRQGKLIGYGQCAAGITDWREKVSELQPLAFNKKWLREHPAVEPTRLFFVPLRVTSIDWRNTCIDGGILFDRCRISALAADVDEKVLSACSKWSSHVLQETLK